MLASHASPPNVHEDGMAETTFWLRRRVVSWKTPGIALDYDADIGGRRRIADVAEVWQREVER